jgi:hypothetical protein
LIGSTSPIRSPTDVSGVASFSPYLLERCSHETGVPELLHHPPAADADGGVRVVVDLAAAHHGGPLVEQADEGADEARLALAALAEEHQVVPREQGALDLGDHGVVVPEDARERVLAGRQRGDEVAADLGLDGAVLVAALAQPAERGGGGRGHPATLRPVPGSHHP